MTNKKYIYGFTALAVLATLGFSTLAFAQTDVNAGVNVNMGAGLGGNFMGRNGDNGNGGENGGGRGGMMNPGVFGTVTAVSGNTITISSTHRTGQRPTTGSTTTTTPVTTTTTYTVDATNAKITKNNVAGTISSIVVGDTIMAQGTLTGTNLVATTVRDGVVPGRTLGVDGKPSGVAATSPITGNGQPVVAGTVSTINGNTLTITNKSNVTYTVDATNAKIVQGQNTITISNVTVGDSVVVQGTINGNSVTASSVIDQKVQSTTTGTTGAHKGFFGSIGAFFSHLFGF